MNYKPSYTWPNPAFPFRFYFESSNCRIFIIENIQHNWNWMSHSAKYFRETDVFLVYCGWFYSEKFAKEAEDFFAVLNLNKKSFFFMFNSELEQSTFAKYGFYGDVINHNAWLDEDLVMRPIDHTKKLYHAIYVGRRSAFKRHYLAAKVQHLALVAGVNHGNAIADVPEHDYLNDAPLSQEQVCEKINQSRCGLILSEFEGACFSSSEYLLCGIPLVSTKSFGGRDVWYNEYNSIICEPDANAIALAVEELNDSPRDPYKIRQMHIEQSEIYRKKFINLLGEIFLKFDVKDVNPETYFRENFFHKLRKSYKPNFEAIFF